MKRAEEVIQGIEELKEITPAHQDALDGNSMPLNYDNFVMLGGFAGFKKRQQQYWVMHEEASRSNGCTIL